MADAARQLVLLCNAGSSSLKLACYELNKSGSHETVFNIGFSGSAQQLLSELEGCLKMDLMEAVDKDAILHVVHRVVHAGRQREGALVIDEQVLKCIQHWQVLAPLHNSLALSIISAVRTLFPDSKHFAVFDSGLYADLPELARYYALPDKLSREWPVERYGFHGLAHRCLWKGLQSHGNYKRVISLQLGSGCSATAWLEGKVMDTSMGFTPLDGLSMASRSGSIDPGVILHLMAREQNSLEQVEHLLNKQSGLVGLSYSDKDIVSVLNADDAQCQFSVEHFCYQVAKMIGAYSMILGGLDAIAFGGGIAEHNPHVLKKVLAYLTFMGFKAGQQQESALHAPDSKIQAWLIPIDEMQEMFEQYRLYPLEK